MRHPLWGQQRAWKQADSGGRTYFIYDGGQPVCEIDGSGNVAAENMFGAWGLVSRNVTGYGNTLYAFDERGNVAHRTNSSGGLLSTDVYDAFGKQRAGAADVWGFGGQASYYTDPETGLVLCTHRFYDPQQGRFLTRDPIGYDGGINLYGYTGNNPINESDPSGLTVTAIFDRRKGSLTIWNDNNPSDRLVIHNVFSGEAQYKNDPGSENMKSIGPIPAGQYLIGSLIADSHMGKHFQMYSSENDWQYLHHYTFGSPSWVAQHIAGSEYPGRQAFNFHAGRNSEGCVTDWSTVDKSNPAYPDSPDWQRILSLIGRSGTTNKGYSYSSGVLRPGHLGGGEFINNGSYSGIMIVR